MRKLPAANETITISAADPLNLVGILVPGERVPSISGKTVTFRDGVADMAPVAGVLSKDVAATA
jgi:ATP-dependent Lhr-like helicase